MKHEKEEDSLDLSGLCPVDRFVCKKIRRPSREIIDLFLMLEDLTPAVSDILDSLGVKSAIPASILSPVCRGVRIVGPAVTVRNIPDNIAPFRSYKMGSDTKLVALDACAIAKKGDILVIDGGAEKGVSSVGGLAVRLYKRAGFLGCIVDCAVRDVGTIVKENYPIWSCGLTPITGKFRFQTVSINDQISCGGIFVRPGDLVLADESGVVVIPHQLISQVASKVKNVVDIESQVLKAIRKGLSFKEITKIASFSEF